MKKLKNQAFTLVELIVVITILAILWTIAFISFQWYSSNARDGVRISDINNIKQNLGIFITEKWFYPIPDNWTQITYSWGTAWTQWTVWDNVTTNLINLSKKPTDPLSNNEYTYSLANNNTEYQLSYVTEWWLSYNIQLTNQANAATTKTATAKVTGTYNEKLLKVSTGSIDYILAVPSIINSDLSDKNLQSIIDNRKLVYNNYQNIPDSYKNLWYTMTWWFDFAPPSNNIVVLSWSTVSLLWETVKIAFINNLKTIYNTIPLNQEPTYTEIINTTGTNEQVALVDTYISNHVWWITWIISTITIPQTYSCTWSLVTANATITNTTWLTTNTDYQKSDSIWFCYYNCINWYTWDDCNTPVFLSNCTENWQIIYTNDIWIEIWRVYNDWSFLSWNPELLDCTWNIIVCAWTNSWYTLQACNLWSNTVGATNNSTSYWKYYQWWNNYGSLAWWATTTTLANASWYNPPTYYTSTEFIKWSNDWTTVQNDNLWWDSTGWSIARKWPCDLGYHVPSQPEWVAINTAWWWETTLWTALSNTLKMPMAGNRSWLSGDMNTPGTTARYWSSSPKSISGYYMYFISNSINPSNSSDRAGWFSIRCIKN